MASASAGRGDEPVSMARFKAAGGAYVGFAADHPEIVRVMFGECGAECRSANPENQEAETPWTLLGRALDGLVTDGFLRPERRVGAELKAWTVVHGFASLSLDGLAAAPTQRERKAALEALLDFPVVGLCAQTPTWGDSKGTRLAASDQSRRRLEKTLPRMFADSLPRQPSSPPSRLTPAAESPCPYVETGSRFGS